MRPSTEDQSTKTREEKGVEISGYGISVDLPPGWDGWIYGATNPVTGGVTAVLQLANFSFDMVIDTFGAEATANLQSGQLFLALAEYDPASSSTPLFSTNPMPSDFALDDYDSHLLQVGRVNQAGLQAFFSDQSRAFCVYSVICTIDTSILPFSDLNATWASLAIAPLAITGRGGGSSS
jgi:hypothetical protein